MGDDDHLHAHYRSCRRDLVGPRHPFRRCELRIRAYLENAGTLNLNLNCGFVVLLVCGLLLFSPHRGPESFLVVLVVGVVVDWVLTFVYFLVNM